MTDLTSSSTWSWLLTTKPLNMSANFLRFYDYWDYGLTKETGGSEFDEEAFINTLRSIKTLTVSGSAMCVLLNSILVLSILLNRENRTFVFFPVLFQAVFDILGPGRYEKTEHMFFKFAKKFTTKVEFAMLQSASGLACGCTSFGFGRGKGCTARLSKTYFGY